MFVNGFQISVFNFISLRLIPLCPLVNASGFYIWRQEFSMIFECLEYFMDNSREHVKKGGDKVILQIFFFFFFSFYYSFLRGDHESESTRGNMNFLFMFNLAASWKVLFLSTCLCRSPIGYREANRLLNAKRLISRKNIISVEVHC